MDNLVKHYALGHSKLDELLLDDDLVEKKRKEHAKKPKRLSFFDYSKEEMVGYLFYSLDKNGHVKRHGCNLNMADMHCILERLYLIRVPSLVYRQGKFKSPFRQDGAIEIYN